MERDRQFAIKAMLAFQPALFHKSIVNNPQTSHKSKPGPIGLPSQKNFFWLVLNRQERVGIDSLPVAADFIMQMGSGGISSIPT